jgi:hypothetical protein
MAVFDMLETALVKKLHFSPSFMLRFVTRTVYVGKCSFQATLFFFQLPILNASASWYLQLWGWGLNLFFEYCLLQGSQ